MNMDEILRRIAQQYGMSRKETLASMQLVVDEGFDNPDPKVRAARREIPFKRGASLRRGGHLLRCGKAHEPRFA